MNIKKLVVEFGTVFAVALMTVAVEQLHATGFSILGENSSILEASNARTEYLLPCVC